MKAARGLTVLITGVMVFFMSAGAFGVEVNIGPAEITLQTEEARKPADFPHRQHQEAYSCTVCHHATGEIMVIDRCGACHNLDISNPEVNSYKKAAHKMCKDCHKKVNEAGGDAPIKCSGCHVKKE